MNIRKLLANIRYKYFNKSKVEIAPSANLHFGGTFITTNINGVNLDKIKIEDNVYIGRYFNLHTASGIHLSKNVVLSDYVYISTLAHGLDPLKGPIMEQAWTDKGPVFIGESSFVGFGVTILPGIKIGKHCVIGAGSIVTKSFPDYSMISGNPAKLIKTFCLDTKDWVKVS